VPGACLFLNVPCFEQPPAKTVPSGTVERTLQTVTSEEDRALGMLSHLNNRQNTIKVGYCEEKRRLLDDFLRTIQELNELLTQQTQAVIQSDPEFSRFDVLIHVAHERKDRAKYAWIAHVEAHQCKER
jgi:hypothetical protein